MADCSLTISELLTTTAARIAALNGDAYKQDGYDECWNESRVLFSVTDSGSPMGHLDFAVIAGRSINTELHDDRFDTFVTVRTPVQIAFAYHIRTGDESQVPDERLAADAAIDVMRAMMRPWPSDTDASIPDDRIVHLVSPWAALVSDDGEWLLITLDFDVTHDIPLTA